MLAQPKELKCIEIAFPIIEKSVLHKVKDLKEANSTIMSLREYRKIIDLKDGLIADKTSIPKSLIYLSLVILLYPLAFLGQLIFNTFFSSKKKAENREKIRKILSKSQITYEVSENKSFIQLWSDKGLRDYGLAHMDEGPYTYEEKFFCLQQWIRILYNENFDLKGFENKIRDRERRRIQEYYKIHPGCHVTPANPIDLIPFEIDKLFGNYKVDVLRAEFSEN